MTAPAESTVPPIQPALTRDRREPPNDAWACAFLEELVRTPSVSGDERNAVEVFVRAAGVVGLESFIDDAGNGVAVRRGSGADPPQIVLLGHIDTVGGNIPVRIEDGVLFGRGTVDAKGPLAAMLAAAARAPIDPRVTLYVVGAVGEETPDSPGARHIAHTLCPSACIIGEPSGVGGFALGYKGSLRLRAYFERSHSHSAGPGGSAADAAFCWWSAVLRAVRAMSLSTDGLFDSLQASVRSVDCACDGLTDSAVVLAGFRLPPRVAPAELEHRIRAIHESPRRLEFSGHIPAFRAARGNDVASALAAAIRDEGITPRPQLKTGTADMNIVGPVWGCPIAAYGPGDSALDHAPTERINLDEFRASIRVLSRALGVIAGRAVTNPSANAPPEQPGREGTL